MTKQNQLKDATLLTPLTATFSYCCKVYNRTKSQEFFSSYTIQYYIKTI